ncbi:MAG: hypothetical protein EOO06_12710 [Chitinophagaceae bacterium]|nr:MAG: hypothetical protein EOO06_12710 [Chitinophagaceae bacterium]
MQTKFLLPLKKNLLSVLCFLLLLPAMAQQNDPLKAKALLLKRFLEKKHYQPLNWDDSASARLYDKWLLSLDEEKLFFTQADIKTLEPWRYNLDEEMKGGNWSFFRKSADLYRQRLNKVDSLIKSALSKPLDFSLNETLQYPFSSFAANDAALQLRWKQYCKWQILRRIADDQDSTALSAAGFVAAEKKALALQKTQEEKYIQGLLRSSPAEFETDLQDDYLNSIAWCYDPHTSYMNMSAKDEFETAMSASEYSVGFEMEDNEKGEPVVSFLQPGGSAWRNGQLHKGDVLVAIKVGKEFKNIADLTESELIKVFTGSSRAETEIKVRTVTGELKIVKLAKEKVSSEEEVVKSYVISGPQNIGYINLPGFYSRENTAAKTESDLNFDGSANDVSKEIVKLKKDSIVGLILDLRYNGGGSIWEAIQLAGIFIDIGPVASLKDRDGKLQFLKDPNRGTIYDGPLLVLVNGASASASEFIAAVLQDYNRAVIVGGTTYGKGTAQIVQPLDTGITDPKKKYGDFVKLTEEKFYRVDGSTTQWKGVEPDIPLPDMYSSDAYKEKSEISALQPDRSKPGMYRPGPALPLAALKAKSESRVSGNGYFEAVKAYLLRSELNKRSVTIPLTWAAYLVQHQSGKKLYNALTKNKMPEGDHLLVRNNSLDKQRYDMSGDYSRETNDAYLKQLATDPVIKEARAVMLDLANKP